MKPVLFSVLLFISGLSYAVREGHEGGGGQRVSANFVEYARYAVEAMRISAQTPGSKFTDAHADAIEGAILSTEVFAFPAKHLCDQGIDPASGGSYRICRDAWFNANSRTISVNEDSWDLHSCLQKMALVLHEYGRAAELENANYAFSSYVFTSQPFRDSCAYLAGRERDRLLNETHQQ